MLYLCEISREVIDYLQISSMTPAMNPPSAHSDSLRDLSPMTDISDTEMAVDNPSITEMLIDPLEVDNQSKMENMVSRPTQCWL